MSLAIHPFPAFHYPTTARRVADLPVTRYGVRQVPAGELRPHAGPAFARLSVTSRFAEQTARGVCGLVPAAAFLDGRIRFHEQTLTARLRQQEERVRANHGALGKPILLTLPTWSPPTGDVRALLSCVGDDNVYHLGAQPATGPLPLPAGPLVIADGHHRAETHARLAAAGAGYCERVPVCVIGGDELTIGTFVRQITGVGATEELLPRLAEFFRVERAPHHFVPQRPGEWRLLDRAACYRLVRRRGAAPEAIDSVWLDQTVLPAVFGITDTRNDERITFAPAPPVTDSSVVADAIPGGSVYLRGYPLPVADFFATVAAGDVLPPKSTLFQPRVPSGLVVWQPA